MTSTTAQAETTTTTAAPAKARSRATRAADKLATDKKATAKRAPAKAAPAKAAPKAPAEPSERAQRLVTIQWLVKAATDAFVKLPVKTVGGVKMVTINGETIPYAVALYAVKQSLGYTPASVWDSRLGPRDVGRGHTTRAA